MRQPIIALAIVLVVVVISVFVKQATAATAPVNTLTMYLDNTTINVKGQNIPACRVQKGGAELVIPAPCDEVAAEIRLEICGGNGPDIDDQTCRLQPFTTFDFVIDGVHTGVI